MLARFHHAAPVPHGAMGERRAIQGIHTVGLACPSFRQRDRLGERESRLAACRACVRRRRQHATTRVRADSCRQRSPDLSITISVHGFVIREGTRGYAHESQGGVLGCAGRLLRCRPIGHRSLDSRGIRILSGPRSAGSSLRQAGRRGRPHRVSGGWWWVRRRTCCESDEGSGCARSCLVHTRQVVSESSHSSRPGRYQSINEPAILPGQHMGVPLRHMVSIGCHARLQQRSLGDSTSACIYRYRDALGRSMDAESARKDCSRRS